MGLPLFLEEPLRCGLEHHSHGGGNRLEPLEI